MIDPLYLGKKCNILEYEYHDRVSSRIDCEVTNAEIANGDDDTTRCSVDSYFFSRED